MKKKLSLLKIETARIDSLLRAYKLKMVTRIKNLNI